MCAMDPPSVAMWEEDGADWGAEARDLKRGHVNACVCAHFTAYVTHMLPTKSHVLPALAPALPGASEMSLELAKN